MPSPKLIALLNEFSGHDLNKFQKYLDSPYLNDNQELTKLYRIVHQSLKKSGDDLLALEKQLNKKVVWKKLFPRQDYKDLYLRRLCSDLIKLAQHFLVLENSKKDSLAERAQLVKLLSKKALEKHFRGAIRQFDQENQKRKWKHDDYYLHQFTVQKSIQQYLERPGIPFKDLSNLEKADFNLDCFYIIKKLKNYCDAIGYRKILSLEADIRLPDRFLEAIADTEYMEEPIIRAYYFIASMMLEPDTEAYFFDLKTFVKQNADLFPISELKTIFIHLNNYCITQKLSVGKTGFIHEIFDNFKFMLAHDLVLKQNTIAQQDFKNIITIALQVEAYQWVEKFIKDYTPKLPQANQENALAYNLAKVYFKQEQYEKVIEQLREVAYSSHVYALGGKQMLLKTYYELDEFLALDSLTESFRTYLRRQKLVTKETKEQYMNFIKFLKRLSKIDPRNQEKVSALLEEIKVCRLLASKSWLLHKTRAHLKAQKEIDY